MKRLTKAEVQALTNKISKEVMPELNKRYQAEKDAVLDAFYQTEGGAHIKDVLDYNDGEFKDCINITNLYKWSGVNNISHNKYGMNGSISDQIVLAQLECEDLDALINTVKESLLKQD